MRYRYQNDNSVGLTRERQSASKHYRCTPALETERRKGKRGTSEKKRTKRPQSDSPRNTQTRRDQTKRGRSSFSPYILGDDKQTKNRGRKKKGLSWNYARSNRQGEQREREKKMTPPLPYYSKSIDSQLLLKEVTSQGKRIRLSQRARLKPYKGDSQGPVFNELFQ